MWKDTTSYSRDDKERNPTTFTAEAGALRVTVTCGHVHYRGEWVMHCAKLGINTKHLPGCESLDEAKRRAVAIVRNEAAKIAESAVELDANDKAQASGGALSSRSPGTTGYASGGENE